MSRGDSQPGVQGIDESCSGPLDNLSTAVVLLDEQLCVRYANPATEQLLATSVSHLLGQSLARFFHDAGWSIEDLRNALQEQRPTA